MQIMESGVDRLRDTEDQRSRASRERAPKQGLGARKRRQTVEAFRCTKCGRVELYARAKGRRID